jgi:hypothetical protein
MIQDFVIIFSKEEMIIDISARLHGCDFSN